MDYIKQFDYSIIHFLNQFARKSPAFDTFVFDVADSDLLKGGIFMAYFWWLWFKSYEAPVRRRAVVVFVLGGIAAAIISRILQIALPYHGRPLHTADLGFVVPIGVNPATLSFWNSFPSDHAVLFFALSMAVWYYSRRLGVVAMIWTFFVICVPRVYLGYHFPSDVIVGAVLGVLIMMAAHRLFTNSGFVEGIVDLERTHRAIFYCLAFLLTYELAILFYDLRVLAVDSIHIIKAIVKAA
ncbi:MAG TPA: phosphatase PAP2 family protein [Alphaproteobacteria bacterium]|nr:phosphatase PAP2 family protein [Alphaproteobacteria bacterium]